LHHLVGDEQAVVAVGDEVDGNCSSDDPQGVDGFAARQRHGAKRECPDYGQQPPDDMFGNDIHDTPLFM
jgi:hypothetical protein